MSETLKPCPFCGGAANLVISMVDDDPDSKPKYYCGCQCGSSGTFAPSPESAARLWNTRHSPPASTDGRQLARVRIAVAVDKHGFWSARGEGVDGTWLEEPNYYALESVDGLPRICPHDPCNGMCPISGPDVHHVVWVTAIVPLPPGEVQGEVEA